VWTKRGLVTHYVLFVIHHATRATCGGWVGGLERCLDYLYSQGKGTSTFKLRGQLWRENPKPHMRNRLARKNFGITLPMPRIGACPHQH